MTTLGYAARTTGARLEPYEYDLGEPEANEVEIAITHCGVCHTDIHIIDGDWATFPAVPGHEIVGVIRNMGANVNGLEIGQRVGVGWQAGSCMHCEWCISGEENLCFSSVDTCVHRPGGYAQAVHVDYRFAHPIPDSLAAEYAAPLLCAGITVYAPMRTHNIAPAARVGVIGIGGLGHLALQYAHAFGCEVTAFSTSPDKEAEAVKFGAHHFIVSSDKDMMKKAANSLDFLLCTVNAQLDWGQYMRILRPNGILCFVGILPGKVEISPGHFTSYQKSVTGSSIGSRTMTREMLEFSARNNILPQIEVMPMSEVNAALDKVRANQMRYRMVLENRR